MIRCGLPGPASFTELSGFEVVAAFHCILSFCLFVCLLFSIFIYFTLSESWSGACAMAQVWSEGNFGELVPSVHHVGLEG